MQTTATGSEGQEHVEAAGPMRPLILGSWIREAI